jgi:hypothetical protein
MTIYKISNLTSHKADYVSDDANIVTANTGNPEVNSITLGNDTKAAIILVANQKAYIETQSLYLSVNKETVDGTYTVLSSINPETVSANEDQVYNVFNGLIGSYVQVTGTTVMKATLEDVKHQLLVAAGLTTYTIVDKVPQPKQKQPPTSGTQTL